MTIRILRNVIILINYSIFLTILILKLLQKSFSKKKKSIYSFTKKQTLIFFSFEMNSFRFKKRS